MKPHYRNCLAIIIIVVILLITLEKKVDYIPPIGLITIFFLTEAELELQSFKSTCNIFITIISLITFYLVYFKIKKSKYIALLIAIIIWIFFVYIKNNYL